MKIFLFSLLKCLEIYLLNFFRFRFSNWLLVLVDVASAIQRYRPVVIQEKKKIRRLMGG